MNYFRLLLLCGCTTLLISHAYPMQRSLSRQDFFEALETTHSLKKKSEFIRLFISASKAHLFGWIANALEKTEYQEFLVNITQTEEICSITPIGTILKYAYNQLKINFSEVKSILKILNFALQNKFYSSLYITLAQKNVLEDITIIRNIFVILAQAHYSKTITELLKNETFLKVITLKNLEDADTAYTSLKSECSLNDSTAIDAIEEAIKNKIKVV